MSVQALAREPFLTLGRLLCDPRQIYGREVKTIATVKWILGSILLLLAAIVGIVVGLAAFLALAFFVTDPLVLGIAAVVVGGSVTCGLAHLLGRWFTRNHRRRLTISWGVVTALLLVVAGWIFLFRPSGFDEMDPIDRDG